MTIEILERRTITVIVESEEEKERKDWMQRLNRRLAGKIDPLDGGYTGP